jgi:hypothetical protein
MLGTLAPLPDKLPASVEDRVGKVEGDRGQPRFIAFCGECLQECRNADVLLGIRTYPPIGGVLRQRLPIGTSSVRIRSLAFDPQVRKRRLPSAPTLHTQPATTPSWILTVRCARPAVASSCVTTTMV